MLSIIHHLYYLCLPESTSATDPSVDFEGGVRTLEGVYLPLGPDLHMDDQSASSSGELRTYSFFNMYLCCRKRVENGKYVYVGM